MASATRLFKKKQKLAESAFFYKAKEIDSVLFPFYLAHQNSKHVGVPSFEIRQGEDIEVRRYNQLGWAVLVPGYDDVFSGKEPTEKRFLVIQVKTVDGLDKAAILVDNETGQIYLIKPWFIEEEEEEEDEDEDLDEIIDEVFQKRGYFLTDYDEADAQNKKRYDVVSLVHTSFFCYRFMEESRKAANRELQAIDSKEIYASNYTAPLISIILFAITTYTPLLENESFGRTLCMNHFIAHFIAWPRFDEEAKSDKAYLKYLCGFTDKVEGMDDASKEFAKGTIFWDVADSTTPPIPSTQWKMFMHFTKRVTVDFSRQVFEGPGLEDKKKQSKEICDELIQNSRELGHDVKVEEIMDNPIIFNEQACTALMALAEEFRGPIPKVPAIYQARKGKKPFADKVIKATEKTRKLNLENTRLAFLRFVSKYSFDE
jgi:hypothetical protein